MRRRLTGALAAVPIVLALSGCRDASDQITSGATEDRVRALLGEPTSVATARADIEFYLGKEGCGATATRVLVFDRWVREDVFVGMRNGTVACVQRAVVMRSH